jgi:F-type H+-transporting ATPase subunit a
MGRIIGCVAVVVTLLAWALAAGVPARAQHGEHLPAEKGEATPPPGKSHESELEQEEKDPLEHVLDTYEIELPESLHLSPLKLPHKEFRMFDRPVTLGLSKFMLLELVAAALVIVIYVPIARRMKSGELPRGGWLNAFEVLLTFIRDEVAEPSIGHGSDKYVPFLWTMFLFILFNNLLGMIPFCGSPTGNIYVTLGLALCVFFAIHGSGAAEMGPWQYAKAMWPHFHMGIAGFFLELFVFLIEWMGVIVRNFVLAVRLFANMFAGHVVLATILIFIYVAGQLTLRDQMGPAMYGTITVLSIFGQIALSLLEIFVAFLQAYIFTFLTALFLGMAIHPAH